MKNLLKKLFYPEPKELEKPVAKKVTVLSPALSKCECGAYFLTGEPHTCK